MRVYGKFWPKATIDAAIIAETLDGVKLYGTDGSDGIIIETDPTRLRLNTDNTKAIYKTNSGQERETESDALVYLKTMMDAVLVNYTLYSPVACQVNDDVYTPLEDPDDWGSSALPNIYTELLRVEWGGPNGDKILLEGGGFLLLESGGFLLLE